MVSPLKACEAIHKDSLGLTAHRYQKITRLKGGRWVLGGPLSTEAKIHVPVSVSCDFLSKDGRLVYGGETALTRES